jgi:hypothetical protein
MTSNLLINVFLSYFAWCVWTLIAVGANIVSYDDINKALVKINDPKSNSFLTLVNFNWPLST